MIDSPRPTVQAWIAISEAMNDALNNALCPCDGSWKHATRRHGDTATQKTRAAIPFASALATSTCASLWIRGGPAALRRIAGIIGLVERNENTPGEERE